MGKVWKALGVMLACVVLAPLLCVFVLFPVVNDGIARGVRSDLEKIPLPAETELRDAASAAGNLAGNGDKIQYFGALLLKSGLTGQQLDAYYSAYRTEDWQCRVERQTGPEIKQTEHPAYFFDALQNETDFSDYYILYSWGDSHWLLQADIRAG